MFEGPIGDSAQEEDPGNGRRFGARNLFRTCQKLKPLGPLVGSTSDYEKHLTGFANSELKEKPGIVLDSVDGSPLFCYQSRKYSKEGSLLPNPNLSLK